VYAQMTEIKVRLENDVTTLKARRGLRWHAGCGPGLGGVVDTDLRARVIPVPVFCGAVFGW